MNNDKCLLKVPTPYQLGIIFSLYSFKSKENKVIFSHRDKYFLEQIQPLFIGNIEKYIVKPSGNIRYRLITRPFAFLKQYFESSELLEKNLTTLPKLKDYHDFLRAYIEINGVLYFKYYYRKDINTCEFKHRLRFIQQKDVIEQIKEKLMIDIGININATTKMHKNSNRVAILITKMDSLKKIYNKYKDDKENFKNFWDKFSKCLEMENKRGLL